MKNDDDDANRQNDRRTLLDFRRACRTHAPSLKHLEKKKTKKTEKKIVAYALALVYCAEID